MLKLAAWLTFTILLAGCSSQGPETPAEPVPVVAWDADSLPPFWSLSFDYVLPAGTNLEWAWENKMDFPVTFKVIHARDDGSTILFATTAAENQDRVTLSEGGAYSLWWTNEGFENVDLSHVVPEGYIEERWPPGRSGGCGEMKAAVDLCLPVIVRDQQM